MSRIEMDTARGRSRPVSETEPSFQLPDVHEHPQLRTYDGSGCSARPQRSPRRWLVLLTINRVTGASYRASCLGRFQGGRCRVPNSAGSEARDAINCVSTVPRVHRVRAKSATALPERLATCFVGRDVPRSPHPSRLAAQGDLPGPARIQPEFPAALHPPVLGPRIAKCLCAPARTT